MIRRGRLFLLLPLLLAPAANAAAQSGLSGDLVVFNAGSLAVPFQRLLRAFEEFHPEVTAKQENSGSLAAVRKITELGRVPDIVALADRTLFPALLEPDHTDWHVTFASNAMVLAVAPDRASRGMPSSTTWPDSLVRPGVRLGRADPEIDPAGYRALMVFQLAEGYYQRPGLTDQLLERAEPRYMRPKSVDLVVLLQLGELDYAWLYSSVASFHGLPVVELPAEVNLSDRAFADRYGAAVVRVPGQSRAPGDMVTITGSPIEVALSIPRAAPNRPAAEAFVAFLLSEAGRTVMEEVGLVALDPPVLAGTPPSSLVP